MRPLIWNPPIELSKKEEQVVKRIHKAKLFVFLRQIRHELFDSDFQTELATIYRTAIAFSVSSSPKGRGCAKGKDAFSFAEASAKAQRLVEKNS